MNVRRDTSSNAALTITTTTAEGGVANLDQLTEEDEPVVSIDDALGPADNDKASEADVLDKPNMDDLDNGLYDDGSHGNDEVVTTVAVVCNGESVSVVGDNKRGEEEPPPTQEPSVQSDDRQNASVQSDDRQNASVQSDERLEPSVQSDERQESSVQSDERQEPSVQSDERLEPSVQSDERLSAEVVIVAPEERHNSFTINASDPDGSTDNEDGDGSSIASSLPGDISPIVTETPIPSTPAITLDLAPAVEDTPTNEITVANGDAPKLSPPATKKNDGRRRTLRLCVHVAYVCSVCVCS